ncbi:MAG: DUF5110 domain-containing protein, partial [Anaerolineales bacterium]|nr:DUF5110 domain-containing protein [Anaerolineales bacterium]
SIYEGYERNGVTQRPTILSRSGTSGIQRYGTAMWSADIGSNFESLATHMNAQMNISLSGIDYFGSDIAGFHRGSISGEPLDELYTVWFANSALLDVPVRPHTENLCNCKETAPDRVGDVASNLANIRLRYALSPYLYSVAHRAYLTGEPVVPPLFFYYQDDLETRALGDHKLLGRDLLVRTVTEPDVTATAVYLPAGRWVNYHTGEMVESAGGWLNGVSTMPNGLFQLPLFVRAGAIVPQMFVDEQTMNLLGMRRDGTTRDELIVYIVPDTVPSAFTLYEDDGRSIAYQSGEVRQTEISQQWTGEQITVEIGAAEGTFSGAAAERDNVVKLVVGDSTVSAVRVNGTALTAIESVADWETAVQGWFTNAGELWVKTGSTAVTEAKEVVVTLSQPSDAAVVVVEDSAAAPAAAPEAAVTEEVPADNVSRVTTRDLLGIGVIVLLIVGWLYLRRQKASS